VRGLRDKVAVVTGAASGIGAGAARRLSEEGARVVVVDWNEDGAADVAASLPGEAVAVRADVSLEEDVERYMSTALERFGSVDLVHLNAGISGTFAPFRQVGTDEFDRVIAVNLRSVFLGLRAALLQFEAQGKGGAIVTTSSLAGIHGSDRLVPYGAAKHAIVGLTKTAANDGAKIGVRVNCIAPGLIETGLMRDFEENVGLTPVVRTGFEENTPLGRFGDPDEVGALVAYLLSDDASYLTGIVIPIDGGVSAKAPTRPAFPPPASAG
jgi:NAD(P)-dependent dehydrogenase (short-subunit alcohol dehydrogenase family)